MAGDDTFVDLDLDLHAPAGTGPLPLPERYLDHGRLAAGGMAEVREVYDRVLRRKVVMKILHAHIDSPSLRARFVHEAQATAQLQHPGIVPVHDLGELPDGRPFFTMKRVRGRTLQEVSDAVHGGEERQWTLRRMIGALHTVAEAMAYAHDLGVVHRDLKPENLMVGAFGTVHVMDWGLAKVLGQPDDAIAEVEVRTEQAHRTRVGAVSGTPSYMPPEQAAGGFSTLGPTADVYALGAILYALLEGRAPYAGADDVLAAVITGPPEPVQGGHPRQLRELCAVAMARESSRRPATAADVALALRKWLDGESRREEARAMVEDARERPRRAEALRRHAEDLAERAARELAEVAAWQPEEDKRSAWALEDEADRLREQVWASRVEQEGLLKAAQSRAQDVVEARVDLLRLYLEDHRRAEALRERRTALQAELGVREQLEGLPADHPEAQAARAYLDGEGQLRLRLGFDPTHVELRRYELEHRRLVARPVRELTDVGNVALPMGSYLLAIGHSGGELRYPVAIGRQGLWAPRRPGDAEDWVLRALELSEGECLVPAGPFEAGDGQGRASSALAPQTVWVDDVVFAAHPVTNAEFRAFLDDLVDRGREEEALRWAPRERSARQEERGSLIYGRDEAGHFFLQPDAEGDLWLEDWPVIMVDWFGARAYARWLAERTGKPWRLPSELEWEKAARGVDGRLYPWGDFADASWACHRDSRPTDPSPARPEEFPVDCSVYGLRHIAGNVREWTLDAAEGPSMADGVATVAAHESPARVVDRGGTWAGDVGWGRTVRRGTLSPQSRDASIGFRVCYSPFRGALTS